MKKTVQKEISVCDICGSEQEWLIQHCDNCDKAICYECRSKRGAMVEYRHGIHTGGSGDGNFCLECDDKLTKSPTPMFAAFKAIERLRTEERAWYADFKERANAAEKHLSGLQDI